MCNKKIKYSLSILSTNNSWVMYELERNTMYVEYWYSNGLQITGSVRVIIRDFIN